MTSLTFISWIFFVAAAMPLELKPSITLANVPETSDYLLERPQGVDIDEAGNFYLVDVEAKVVFCWDKTGQFLRTIGKPGTGPGEFVFSGGRGGGGGGGGGQGYITAVEEELYVFDGAQRKVLIFDRKGNFRQAIPLNLQRGGVRAFFVTPDKKFLLHRLKFSETERTTEILLLDQSGEVLKTLATQPDDTFDRRGTGREATFSIKVFNPTLTTSYNRQTGILLVGQTGQPSFDRFDQSGKKETIKAALNQVEVTQADKDEFMKRDLNGGGRRGNRRVSYNFADKKPYYDQVLAVGDRGYLIYSISPTFGKVEGRFLDRQGKILDRFQTECGESGSLMGTQGRIIAIRVDDDGEFTIQELDLPEQT